LAETVPAADSWSTMKATVFLSEVIRPPCTPQPAHQGRIAFEDRPRSRSRSRSHFAAIPPHGGTGRWHGKPSERLIPADDQHRGRCTDRCEDARAQFGNFPDDAEAGGGLLVAVIQMAITLGAGAGGFLFDAGGYRATFVAAAVLLTGSAFLAWLDGRTAGALPAGGGRG
jgi:hypothetical protein